MRKLLKFGHIEAIALLFIVAVATWRVFTISGADNMTMANFTPVGAMALFGGAYFARTKAIIFPLLTLWLSDIMLNRFVYFGEWIIFYDGYLWVYGAFALMVLAARWLQPNRNVTRFAGSSLVIVFIHWIVTDIGVWLSGTLYPTTPEGLWLCLLAAIPFELNLLAGTLLYGGVMFGLFEYSKKKAPALQDTAPG
jgi:hypothetical protein